MAACRYCKSEIPGTAWTSSFICDKCDKKIENEFYAAAHELKKPKFIKYWKDYFKNKYSEQHLLEALWRMLDDGRMYLTNDLKVGVR